MVGVGSMVMLLLRFPKLNKLMVSASGECWAPASPAQAAASGGEAGVLGRSRLNSSPLEDLSQKDMHPSALTPGSSEGLCILSKTSLSDGLSCSSCHTGPPPAPAGLWDATATASGYV